MFETQLIWTIFLFERRENCYGGYRNIPFTLSYIPFSYHCMGKLVVSSGPGLTGSTHYLLCSWVPRGGFSQPQDPWYVYNPGLVELVDMSRPEYGTWASVDFYIHRASWKQNHRYQETSLISFLKANKRGTSRKKLLFKRKKSILCDFKNAET